MGRWMNSRKSNPTKFEKTRYLGFHDKPKLNGNCDEYINFKSFWQKHIFFLGFETMSVRSSCCATLPNSWYWPKNDAFENGVSRFPGCLFQFGSSLFPICSNIFNFAACSPYPLTSAQSLATFKGTEMSINLRTFSTWRGFLGGVVPVIAPFPMGEEWVKNDLVAT